MTLDTQTTRWLFKEIFGSDVAKGDLCPAEHRVPPSKSMPKKVFLGCHYCGYTPDDGLPETGMCPKCHSSSWDRYALAARLVRRT